MTRYAGSEVVPIGDAPWADAWRDIDGLRWAWRAWCGEAVVYGATSSPKLQAQQDARRAREHLLGERWSWRTFSVAKPVPDPLLPGVARYVA